MQRRCWGDAGELQGSCAAGAGNTLALTLTLPLAIALTLNLARSRREPWTHAAFNPDGRPKPFFVYKSYTVPHAGGWGNSNEDGAPVPDPGPFAKETSWPEVERDPNPALYGAHISPTSRPHLAYISPTSP